jgi:hypothetical protein
LPAAPSEEGERDYIIRKEMRGRRKEADQTGIERRASASMASYYVTCAPRRLVPFLSTCAQEIVWLGSIYVFFKKIKFKKYNIYTYTYPGNEE